MFAQVGVSRGLPYACMTSCKALYEENATG